MSIVSVTHEHNLPHVGDVATVTLGFKSGGVAVSPTAVYVDVIEGDGTAVTYQYDVDPEVIKDAGEGAYHITLPLTSGGTWRVGARATGLGQTVEPVRFFVHVYDAKTTP